MKIKQETESVLIGRIQKLQVKSILLDWLFAFILAFIGIPVSIISILKTIGFINETFALSGFIFGLIQIIGIIGIIVSSFFIVYLAFLILRYIPYDSIKKGINLALEDVFFLKKARNKEMTSLKKLIEEDKRNIGVDVNLVVEIKKLIQEISETIGEYPLLFKNLQKKRKYGFLFQRSFYFISLINILIENEKQELIALIKNFTISIQSWTQLHQKELFEIEQELEQQSVTTESLSGQGAIDLQRVRLHEHIENLNKITNTL